MMADAVTSLGKNIQFIIRKLRRQRRLGTRVLEKYACYSGELT